MSSTEIGAYLKSTSPISKLKTIDTNTPLHQIHNSVDKKLQILSKYDKNKIIPKLKKSGKYIGSDRLKKNQEMEMKEYKQLKANSIIYNIPELTPPQISFQVSNELRSRINEIKSDIITKFPTIKSSQYNPTKIQSILSKRATLKDLQEWLKQKLQNPPLTIQDSIQYKNMIMSLGMKQIIRIINIRCIQQGHIIQDIWELTWAICRQIIIYLSQRAHRCQKILQEQTNFFRKICQEKINYSQLKLQQLQQSNIVYKQRSQKLSKDLSKLHKKSKQYRLTLLSIQQQNKELKQNFEILFKQNMLLNLKANHNNTKYKKQAKKRYEKLLWKSITRSFQLFIQKLIKQNYVDIEEEEGELELNVDINKFKEQFQCKKIQIQLEIMNLFKTKQETIQTDICQLVDQSQQTLICQVSQIGIQTQTKEFQQIQVNTDETSITRVQKQKQKRETKLKSQKKPKKQYRNSLKRQQSKSKLKQIKKQSKDPIIEQGIEKQKKQNKIQQIINSKQKLTLIQNQQSSIEYHQEFLCSGGSVSNFLLSVVQEENNGYKQDVGLQKNQEELIQLHYGSNLQCLNTSKSQHHIIENNNEKVIQHKKIDIIPIIPIKIQKIENKQSPLIIQQKQKEQKELKELNEQKNKQQQNNHIQPQKITNVDMLNPIDLIDKNQQYQNIKQNNHHFNSQSRDYSNIYVTSEMDEKSEQLEQISQLKSIMAQSQRKTNQIKSLKSQLINRNKTISSLYLQLQALKDRRVSQSNSLPILQKQAQIENNIKMKQDENSTSRIIGQDKETQNLLNFVRQKNYSQLLNILIQKAGIPDDVLNFFDEGEINNHNKKINMKEEENTFKKNHASRFSCQIVKKQFGTHQERRKLSLNNQDFEATINQNIDEMDGEEWEEDSNHSGVKQHKKTPKRLASVPYSQGVNFHQLVFRRKKMLQQPNKIEHTINFSGLCSKYLLQNQLFDIGKITKLNGVTEHIKKNIREQYREVYRQVPEKDYGQKNQKYMRMLIQKAFNSLLKQLCKEMLSAQKQGLQRIEQVKQNYSSLPILMMNRLNRNYGVRKVASKSIKDLMLCLKGVKKYTDKYSIISYFMLSSNSLFSNNSILQYQDTQLFFFYILLITLFQGMLSDLEVQEEEIVSIAIITKKHLTTDSTFINGLCQLPLRMRNQKNCNFINFYHKFIEMYKNLYLNRMEEMEFIYYALPKQFYQGGEGVGFEDFVQFLSVFNIKYSNTNTKYGDDNIKHVGWMNKILKCMSHVLREQKFAQKGIITRQIYIKFLVKCPQFNLSLLNQYIGSIVGSGVEDIGDIGMQDVILTISNNLMGASDFKESELGFWLKYIRLYVLEKQVDEILGCLVYGVFDPRVKAIMGKS